MTKIYEQAYLGDRVVPLSEAHVSVASSAVLYGLSVYTVFPVVKTDSGFSAFRLADHWRRLTNSAKIIGIDTFTESWTEERFAQAAKEVVAANDIGEDVFVRATIHVTELAPGTRSRGLKTALSIFIYEAACILPKEGARVKTSVWRRIPDYAIPSRAKVNGAYVNSVLARQDAIDCGYDDSVFLDTFGHVCELSAANLFLVRDGVLYTPNRASDILEGISRKTIFTVARDMGMDVREHSIDFTELYVADEIFACGTSAYLTPILEVDKRPVNGGIIGPITKKLQARYLDTLRGKVPEYQSFFTPLQ